MRLFRQFILRRLALEPLRSAGTALGVALGVAVIVAIQLTNASSLAGFSTALDTLSGRASLEIVGPAGWVDERLLPDLLWLGRYGAMAPVIEADLALRQPERPPETLRLLGIDILRDRPLRDYRLIAGARDAGEPSARDLLALLLDPQSAILTAKFAAAHGLAVGSTFQAGFADRTFPLTVRGLLADEGPARVLDGRFVLMDIASAQRLLERYGRIDRLELRLAGGVAIDRAEAAIASRLPSGLAVERPARRGRQVENMLAAFHLNLTALSYIALLVGLFLVYNTVSVAVLARREEIGALRALGVTRGEVRALFLGEAAALALFGCLLGLPLGWVLADGAVALTSTTVSVLYIATAAGRPVLGAQHVALAFGTAVPLALVAALVPAREAARVPPTAALRGADLVEARRRPTGRRLGLPALLLALGAWLATLGPVHGFPLFGYAAAVAIVFGASFLVPIVLTLVIRAVERPVRSRLRVEDWLAVRNLAAAVPRISISVAALAVSLSMMVAIAVMIGSFRETVIYWVAQTLQADLFVGPGTRRRTGGDESLSAEVTAGVSASPDVAAVDRFRVREIPYGDSRIRLGCGEFDVLLAHATLLFKEPRDARDAMRQAIGQDAVVVSESFALKYRVRPGDRVPLPTPDGMARFRVAAVYYDYSNDRGVVMMDRATYARYYRDVAPSGLSVYLKAGVDPERARERLLAVLGDRHRVSITTNAAVRTEALRVFDSTFAITYALELVAILVAILGVAGSLLTRVLERAPELALLGLLGLDRRRMRRMVLGEAAVIGAVSQAVGLLIGLALSLVLIYVINVQSFGWTIQFHLPVAFLVQSSLATIAATTLAGLYPARRAIGLTPRQDE